jgi:hypothetical protein
MALKSALWEATRDVFIFGFFFSIIVVSRKKILSLIFSYARML